MNRVIGYARTSLEKQDEGKRQIEDIQDFCKEDGYIYIRTISEVISGAKEDRGSIIELLSLTSDDCDMVVISESSRLSREDDYLNLLNIVNRLLKADLDVYFLDGKKMYNKGKNLSLFEIIQLSFEAKANAEERVKIKKRLLSGRISKSKEGCFVGHRVAYGYKVEANPLKVKNDNKHGTSLYKIDETKTDTVKLIFDLIGNKGYTIRGTAKYLNSIGQFRDGKKWISVSVANMIHNPLYMGVYTFAQTVTQREAIIDPELYEKVQLQLKSNYIFKDNSRKNYYIFKGILKCHCGSSMVQSKKKEGTFTMRCLSKRSGYSMIDCHNFGLDREFLNSIIWTILKGYLSKDDFKDKTKEQRKQIEIDIKEKIKQIDKKHIELELKEKQINNLIDSLSESRSKAITNRINDKLLIIEQEQAGIKEHIKQFNKELIELKNFNVTLENSFDIKELETISELDKRQIYLTHIEKIVYYGITPYYGYVIIYYKAKNNREIVMTQILPTGRKAYHYLLDNGLTPLYTREADSLIARLNSEDRINKPLSFVPSGFHDGTFKDYFKTEQAQMMNIPLIKEPTK